MTLASAGLYGPQAVLTTAGVPIKRTDSVTVYLHGTTTVADLYTSHTMGTTHSNPTTTDSHGNLAFYAAPGLYDLSFLVGGVGTTLTVVVAPWYTDSEWQVGDLKETARTGLDGGGVLIDTVWMVPDHTLVSKTTYAKLFTALGGATSPWGETGTNFHLPDYRGRTLIQTGTVGTHTQPSVAMGATGGHSTITLTAAQLAAHSHGVTDPEHKHSLNANGDTSTQTVVTVPTTSTLRLDATGNATRVSYSSANDTGTAATGITINDTGTTAEISVISPYAGVQRLIKVL